MKAKNEETRTMIETNFESDFFNMLNTLEQATGYKEFSDSCYGLIINLIKIATGSFNPDVKPMTQLYGVINDQAILSRLGEVFQFSLNIKKLKHYKVFPDGIDLDACREYIVFAALTAYDEITGERLSDSMPAPKTKLEYVNSKLRNQISKTVSDSIERTNNKLHAKVNRLEKNLRFQILFSAGLASVLVYMLIAA
jgi:hypothetical protein